MLSTYVGQSMTNLLQISAPGQKSRAHIFAGGRTWIYLVTSNKLNPVPCCCIYYVPV